MNLLERRRALMMAGETPIPTVEVELPDYWRLDFTTTEANTNRYVGYYALANVQDIILDGVHNLSLGHNGSGAYVTIPTAGDHILYIKTPTSYSNSYYQFRLQGTLKYARIPYDNIAGFRLGGDSRGLVVQKIDILRKKYPGEGPQWEYSSLGDIRVPVGTLDYFKTASGPNGANWYGKSNSITEVNFVYETS